MAVYDNLHYKNNETFPCGTRTQTFFPPMSVTGKKISKNSAKRGGNKMQKAACERFRGEEQRKPGRSLFLQHNGEKQTQRGSDMKKCASHGGHITTLETQIAPLYDVNSC